MDLNGYENGYAMKTSGLKISPEMLRLNGEIDEFKGSWRTLPTLARRLGRITTGDAEKLTGAPRPTVKTRLGELVKRGLLVRQGQGRGAWYGMPPQ